MQVERHRIRVGSVGLGDDRLVPGLQVYRSNAQNYTVTSRGFAGDKLQVTCTYDTRGQTQTVTQGEGTGDEMCITLLYVTAAP